MVVIGFYQSVMRCLAATYHRLDMAKCGKDGFAKSLDNDKLRHRNVLRAALTLVWPHGRNTFRNTIHSECVGQHTGFSSNVSVAANSCTVDRQ